MQQNLYKCEKCKKFKIRKGQKERTAFDSLYETIYLLCKKKKKTDVKELEREYFYAVHIFRSKLQVIVFFIMTTIVCRKYDNWNRSVKNCLIHLISNE